MYTDPARIHGNEPGKVEGNPVFVYLDAFGDAVKSPIQKLKARYKEGAVKDVEVKEFLFDVLEKFLEPIRKRRDKFKREPEFVDKILRDGAKRVGDEANKTLNNVKRAMKFLVD